MDKLLHFLACLVVTLPAAAIRGWLPALGLGLLTGLAKEIHDEARYHGFDWKDIIADIAGIALGTMAGTIIRIAAGLD